MYRTCIVLRETLPNHVLRHTRRIFSKTRIDRDTFDYSQPYQFCSTAGAVLSTSPLVFLWRELNWCCQVTPPDRQKRKWLCRLQTSEDSFHVGQWRIIGLHVVVICTFDRAKLSHFPCYNRSADWISLLPLRYSNKWWSTAERIILRFAQLVRASEQAQSSRQ
jgi:hypothetical protein